MNIKRAIEIARSPIMANVSYNGDKIYIEDVNESRGTARIHSLQNPSNKQEVELASLVEFERK